MIIPLEVAGLVHVNKTVVFVGCDVKFCGISTGTIHRKIIIISITMTGKLASRIQQVVYSY